MGSCSTPILARRRKLATVSASLAVVLLCYLAFRESARTPVTADELLTNPGFEITTDNRPQGWSSLGGTLSVTSTFARTGNYAAVFESATATQKWIYQVVPVRSGASYNLSGYMLKNDVDVDRVFLRIRWLSSTDGTGSSIADSDSSPLTSNSPDYVLISTGRAVAPPNARSASVRIMLLPVAAAPGQLYVDDLSLVEEIDPPTLTSTSSPSRTPTATATPSPSPSPSSTALPSATATGTPPAVASLVGSVQLQARGAAPGHRWIVPLTVTLHAPGSLTPSLQLNPTTDPLGHFTVTGIAPDKYDIRVRKAHTLANRRPDAELTTGLNFYTLGALLEGDANEDGVINSLDYAPLATAYFKVRGEAGFDARVDFNDDGRIASADYAVLAANYLKGQGSGDRERTPVPCPLIPTSC